MKPRRFGEDFYLGLKARWHQLVREAGGTAYAAALTGTYESRISEWGANQHLDKFPPLDKIADIELDRGIPLITRYLADLHGYDLVQREAHQERGIHSHFNSIVTEVAELQTRMATAMSDGTITDQECAEIAKEAQEAANALQAMIAEFRAPGTIRAVK